MWGGDPACVHEWSTEEIATEVGGGNWAQAVNGRGEAQPGGLNVAREPVRRTATRGSCLRGCGAWLGNLGLEPTPEMWVANLVAVFEEVRRVLRDDGSLWLNLGDCYATGAGKVGESPGGGAQGEAWKERAPMTAPNRMPIAGLKPKDLVGLPWRAAFALQAAGWYLRSDIIWSKPNPMPESVLDRPTKAHEYIFLLSKSERYFYDTEAVREMAVTTEVYHGDYSAPGGKVHRNGRLKTKRPDGWASYDGAHGTIHRDGREAGVPALLDPARGRNRRTVWTIPAAPFHGAHFATFPPALVEPCILAGTSEHGCCSSCGSPFTRQIEPTDEYKAAAAAAAARGTRQVRSSEAESFGLTRGSPNPGILPSYRTIGWSPSCACAPTDRMPCIVLDPFSGAGTTGLVALRMGRDYLGIELNPKYVEMARRRIAEDAPLLNAIAVRTRWDQP